MILGLKPENIRVIFRRGSGCYGCNGADTVTYDAAILSQAVGKPVRVQLTRKDEMAFENYGNAFVIDQRASLDPSGNITSVGSRVVVAGLGRTSGNQPARERHHRFAAGIRAGGVRAPAGRSRARASQQQQQRRSVVPRAAVTGTVQSGRVLTHNVESRFWTGPLRSPARLQNTFAHESFMDELAARVKADPVEYRLRHLRDARLKEVLQAAAKTANWETRPSPKPGNRNTGIASGRGAACVLYEGDNGYTALVAEIEVNQDTGKIVVKRMVAASDVGPISNPDGLRNQVEGGALQGLSRCLGEEVTWDNEKITSVDWRTYHSLPLGFEVPKIECVLINRTEGEAMGAGETSITLVAAAIGNAIFDATGARIRQIPFTAERIKAALAARA